MFPIFDRTTTTSTWSSPSSSASSSSSGWPLPGHRLTPTLPPSPSPHGTASSRLTPPILRSWARDQSYKTFCPNSFDLNVTDFSEGTASTILEMCLVYFQICEVTSFQTLVRSCLCTRLAETKKTVVCHLKVKRQISKMIKQPWNMLLLNYIFLRFCFLTECLPITLLYDQYCS